jgi:hypothetical protein
MLGQLEWNPVKGMYILWPASRSDLKTLVVNDVAAIQHRTSKNNQLFTGLKLD